jgi:hypothetical protein
MIEATVDQHLRVIEVDPSSDDRWDAFVRNHRSGLVFHHSNWLRTLQREYARESFALLCESGGGRVCGILPLVRTSGLPLVPAVGGQVVEPRLSSLPRTPVAGPLFTSREAGAALLAAAVDLVRAEPSLRLQLKAESAELEPLADEVAGAPWRLTYVLPLPERAEELRFGSSRNHSRVRWAVNKALRSNVHVRQAESADDLRAWYGMYLEAMRWHALPPRPYRLFTAMQELLQPSGSMMLLLAERRVNGRTQLLAGSIFLKFGGTMFYAFNGRRLDALPLRPNELLLWRAIHDAWEEGFRRIDLGEVVEGDESLAVFKKKWGTTPTCIHRYYYPPLSAPPGAPQSHGRGAALAKGAWRHVPLRATELLGRGIYRYL